MTKMPRIWLATLCWAVLSYLMFFPCNLGFLAWFAMVPWFVLVVAERPKSFPIYLACFVGNVGWHAGVSQWIRVAHPAMYASWAIIALFGASMSCLCLFLARKLRRAGVPFWLAGTIAIVAIDYMKAHFPYGYPWLDVIGRWQPIGFAWYFLGHTQHDFLPIAQMADLTGVYGITFVLMLVNGILAASLFQRESIQQFLRLSQPIAPIGRIARFGTVMIVCSTLLYGYVRLNQEEYTPGPRVALLQTNLEQDIKNDRGREMYEEAVQLSNKAIKTPKEQTPDLLIYPETGFPLTWYDLPTGVDRRNVAGKFQRAYNQCRMDATELAERWPVKVLYGLNRVEWESNDRFWKYNSALLVDEQGKVQATYDKIHLVPFGEYVPLVEYLPFMQRFTPYENEYSCRPGQQFTRFPLDTAKGRFHFGTLICYEDTDPGFARRYVADQEPVDFLVNMSNDGWFQGTEEHDQHLAIARFRAIEARRSLVRAVNMGISAIIDPAGRVVLLAGTDWKSSKKVSAVVSGHVPLGTQFSLYSRVGDWLPILCWGVVFVTLSIRVFKRVQGGLPKA